MEDVNVDQHTSLSESSCCSTSFYFPDAAHLRLFCASEAKFSTLIGAHRDGERRGAENPELCGWLDTPDAVAAQADYCGSEMRRNRIKNARNFSYMVLLLLLVEWDCKIAHIFCWRWHSGSIERPPLLCAPPIYFLFFPPPLPPLLAQQESLAKEAWVLFSVPFPISMLSETYPCPLVCLLPGSN